MIQNAHQLTVTLDKLEGLNNRLERLALKYPDEETFDFFAETTRRHIKQMEREVTFYRMAKGGHTEQLLEAWNSKGGFKSGPGVELTLGALIGLVRLSRGLTLEQFADQAGLEPGDFSRCEQDDLESCSIEALERLFNALGVRFTIVQVVSEGAA